MCYIGGDELCFGLLSQKEDVLINLKNNLLSLENLSMAKKKGVVPITEVSTTHYVLCRPWLNLFCDANALIMDENISWRMIQLLNFNYGT